MQCPAAGHKSVDPLESLEHLREGLVLSFSATSSAIRLNPIRRSTRDFYCHFCVIELAPRLNYAPAPAVQVLPMSATINDTDHQCLIPQRYPEGGKHLGLR
jgi:hypothetical protein